PEFRGDRVEARQVASRPIEAGNKPKLHGVSADIEHNWDAGGRSLSRARSKRSGCDNHSHLKLDQISRQCWQSVDLVSRPAIFNHKVPAFNITRLVQTSPEAGQSGGVGFWRPEVQVPDYWERRLLRPRRERPRHPAAERGDECAPSKANAHPALPCQG